MCVKRCVNNIRIKMLFSFFFISFFRQQFPGKTWIKAIEEKMQGKIEKKNSILISWNWIPLFDCCAICFWFVKYYGFFFLLLLCTNRNVSIIFENKRFLKKFLTVQKKQNAKFYPKTCFWVKFNASIVFLGDKSLIARMICSFHVILFWV